MVSAMATPFKSGCPLAKSDCMAARHGCAHSNLAMWPDKADQRPGFDQGWLGLVAVKGREWMGIFFSFIKFGVSL